ncbi:hypothetical protein NSE_0906 [Neorickettsia sennetsu str. Miyayama]|uniref:Uncharacterized protein n=1 Tax=Ehrlichia sennetsu (strain ATCC VR-367 / Miyayama) TaxID=222891 RepID=Q2GCM5_EHRS3|nr:hypothetical protein NSE_0906 [Neorickettsia sennetsu str. Miyayama]
MFFANSFSFPNLNFLPFSTSLQRLLVFHRADYLHSRLDLLVHL